MGYIKEYKEISYENKTIYVDKKTDRVMSIDNINFNELPIGTRFKVLNGGWYGEIVESGGKKCIQPFNENISSHTGKLMTIRENDTNNLELLTPITFNDITHSFDLLQPKQPELER